MASKMHDGLGRSPVHLLHRAGQCAEELFQAEIGEADLTARQLAVLNTVAENEGLSQTGIVERTGIDCCAAWKIDPVTGWKVGPVPG